ncbi:hypothetical protein E2C01_032392 [Portunus trituberculatus]|uniref:Uncharacterized protein n=1 Tax=Portunus trituberculatus TaxID=210409 RepID=A0A5B7F0M3_PORTR|nr:hypothetical protein [Portunus trituberculatus]
MDRRGRPYDNTRPALHQVKYQALPSLAACPHCSCYNRPETLVRELTSPDPPFVPPAPISIPPLPPLHSPPFLPSFLRSSPHVHPTTCLHSPPHLSFMTLFVGLLSLCLSLLSSLFFPDPYPYHLLPQATSGVQSQTGHVTRGQGKRVISYYDP